MLLGSSPFERRCDTISPMQSALYAFMKSASSSAGESSAGAAARVSR